MAVNSGVGCRSQPAASSGGGRRPTISWFGGGANGNERLTVVTGLVLIPLLAVIGLTVLFIGQLLSVHLFVGLLLIGPVGLKLASTGYRFARYYTGNAAYRFRGPPELWLRVIAPVVILSTLVVFLSGVLLLLDGPGARGPLRLAHKASFIVWVVFMALHVLGHLVDVTRFVSVRRQVVSLAPAGSVGSDRPAGRSLALVAALILGLALALLLIPDFAAWTSHGASAHAQADH